MHSAHTLKDYFCSTSIIPLHKLKNIVTINVYFFIVNGCIIEFGLGSSESTSNTSVAYFENPGILMVVQTIGDSRGLVSRLSICIIWTQCQKYVAMYMGFVFVQIMQLFVSYFIHESF